jgi:hypothetical protein
MSAIAKAVEPEVEIEEKPDNVLINVRFMPSGDIFSIDGLPEQVPPKVWYEHLLMNAPEHYQTLAGGRGFFRIPRPSYEALLANAGK